MPTLSACQTGKTQSLFHALSKNEIAERTQFSPVRLRHYKWQLSLHGNAPFPPILGLQRPAQVYNTHKYGQLLFYYFIYLETN